MLHRVTIDCSDEWSDEQPDPKATAQGGESAGPERYRDGLGEVGVPGQTENRMGQPGDRDGNREQDQGLGQEGSQQSHRVDDTGRDQGPSLPDSGSQRARREIANQLPETNQRDDERRCLLRWRRVRAPREPPAEGSRPDRLQPEWSARTQKQRCCASAPAPGSRFVQPGWRSVAAPDCPPLDSNPTQAVTSEPIDLFGARSGATVMRELAVRYGRRALGPRSSEDRAAAF